MFSEQGYIVDKGSLHQVAQGLKEIKYCDEDYG
jgi:hypothetical protein